MNPVPANTSPGGRAFNQLRNLARRDGRDPAEYLTIYVLEGFLSRLAASSQADAFVLKGGVLMAAYASRRPTRDIDLAAVPAVADTDELVSRIRTILTLPADDGLVFDPAGLSARPIRESAAYPGVRVRMAAKLASARIEFHVDINLGDPIWPAPTTTNLPLLLGGTLQLTGYPDHMILAEKIATACDRGNQNTRWRDFLDIATLTSTRVITYADQVTALNTVAETRHIRLRPLAQLLDTMPALVASRWGTWRRRQHLETTAPADFAEVLRRCSDYADPVIAGTATGTKWNPLRHAWEAAPNTHR